MIAFEVRSWGAPLTQWRYTLEYGGVWVEVAPKPDAPQPTWTKDYHTLEADPARYAALEAIVRKLPTPAPDAARCTNFMTDAPYGTIRLTRGATTTEISWNSGCLDDDYAAFTAVLREADQMVAAWGKAVEVNRTEDHLVP